jgi:hypothetical protein
MTTELSAPASAARTDRRALIKGALTMSALALAMKPKPSLASVKIEARDDRALLALGRRLDAMWPELKHLDEVVSKLSWAAMEEVERRLGATIGNLTTPEQHAALMPTWKTVNAEYGADVANDARTAAFDKADKIHAQIMTTPAHTLAGVAAKARASAMLSFPHYWDEPAEELDWDKRMVRQLIEATCAAAGRDLPVFAG